MMGAHLSMITPRISFEDTCGIAVSEIAWLCTLSRVIEHELDLSPGSIATLSQLGGAYSHLQETAQSSAASMARLERVVDQAIRLALDAQKDRTDLAGLAMRGLLRKHLAGRVVTAAEHEQVARLQRMHEANQAGGIQHAH